MTETNEQRENNLAAVAKLMQESSRIWIKRTVVQRYDARIRVRASSTYPLGICGILWPPKQPGKTGTFYPQKRRKLQKSVTYVWDATGGKAYAVAKEIFPYLVGAQQTRLLCLREFYEECFIARGDLGGGLRTRLTIEEQSLRESFWLRMQAISKISAAQKILDMEEW